MYCWPKTPAFNTEIRRHHLDLASDISTAVFNDKTALMVFSPVHSLELYNISHILWLEMTR